MPENLCGNPKVVKSLHGDSIESPCQGLSGIVFGCDEIDVKSWFYQLKAILTHAKKAWDQLQLRIDNKNPITNEEKQLHTQLDNTIKEYNTIAEQIPKTEDFEGTINQIAVLQESAACILQKIQERIEIRKGKITKTGLAEQIFEEKKDKTTSSEWPWGTIAMWGAAGLGTYWIVRTFKPKKT